MFGELKGGADPAGADEHWKTAISALARIKTGCRQSSPNVKLSFVGAAIEENMANEIWQQLKEGVLNHAANLTIEGQVTNYCNWMLTL